ncbi:MAG: tRNA pseudouridine(13) synthase TruD [Pseudohongiella sp.]|uniref:tRNA pseudouridine(13) synthase TruD n=1 Tax=Pseudohongiella sp. TaxID=1979412 RepID=UPI0034A04A75
MLQARFKVAMDDFVVNEVLGFECSGEGEHLWLQVRKTGITTSDVAGRLARATGLRQGDISWSGQKDKHGVCTQWFSLHWPKNSAGHDLGGLAQIESDDLIIEQQLRNSRKLRRGSHRSNQFRIRLRDVKAADGVSLSDAWQDLDIRMQAIEHSGVPNYFGEQRFGHANLANAEAWFAGKTRPRGRLERGMWLSAARSALFNAVLARRVAAGNWNRWLPGDVMNLNGSGSVFVSSADDADLPQRLADMDIHPTGPLWGQGALASRDSAAALEQAVADEMAVFSAALPRYGLQQERRSLRLPVKALDYRRPDDGTLEIEFTLPTGTYATAVLHELCGY